MNYGFNHETKGWKEDKKNILAYRLKTELNLDNGWVAGGKRPYIEIDGLYEGVRIRKITYLTDDEANKLIKKADDIYNEVMSIKSKVK